MGLKPCRYLYTTREPEQCGRGKCPEIVIPVDQNECQTIHSNPHYIGYTCARREWTDKESADPRFWKIRGESCANCKEIGREHIGHRFAPSSSPTAI